MYNKGKACKSLLVTQFLKIVTKEIIIIFR